MKRVSHTIPAAARCVHKDLPAFSTLIFFTQPKVGVDRGPIHLVEAGLPKQLAELGWQVVFDGHHQFEEINTEDDPPIGKLKNPRFVSTVCKAVAQVVSEHAKQGRLPLTLGGDHSLASPACVPLIRSQQTHSLSENRPWVLSPGLSSASIILTHLPTLCPDELRHIIGSTLTPASSG